MSTGSHDEARALEDRRPRLGVSPRAERKLGGDRVRAFDIGDPGEVYTNAGTQGWPVALPYIFGVAGLVALVFGLQHWALYLWRAVRRG